MSQTISRVGIDCRLAGQRHAGIGRYTEHLVRELLQRQTPYRWVLFFSDQEQADQVLANVSYEGTVEVVLAPVQHYSLGEQLQMPSIFNQQRLDILHIPHFNVPFMYSGKVVVTIHDLLWHEYRGSAVTTLPKWQYWPKYVMYRLTASHAIRKAAAIIVPTQTVAKQVARYYPETVAKTVVIAEGVAPHFFEKSSIPTPKAVQKYFVYLGSLYPHKNVTTVIQALRELPEYSLKVVSSRSAFQQRLAAFVSEQKLTDRVEFMGYQSDEKVRALLGEATALVQPSLSEGFGLTGLEAMAAGTPVIASDIPVFREVYQHHALFFSPQDTASFVQAAQTAATMDRQKHLKAAQTYAKQFQWSKMAESTLKVYANALAL